VPIAPPPLPLPPPTPTRAPHQIFVLSTWTDGLPPAPAVPFCEWLADMAVDFRVSKAALAKLRFAAFGLGDVGFEANFCRPVRELDRHLRAMGAKRVGTVGLGDESSGMQAGEW
jgi:tRNA wybutosine-synthesizing protein 1